MSQFIVIWSECEPPVPAGLAVRPLAVSDPFVVDAALKVFDGARLSQLFALTSAASGDADALIDELYDRIQRGEEPGASALLRYLGELADAGVAFACWYGASFEDLPASAAWSVTRRVIAECASHQPPEVYARYLGRAPAPGPGRA